MQEKKPTELSDKELEKIARKIISRNPKWLSETKRDLRIRITEGIYPETKNELEATDELE